MISPKERKRLERESKRTLRAEEKQAKKAVKTEEKEAKKAVKTEKKQTKKSERDEKRQARQQQREEQRNQKAAVQEEQRAAEQAVAAKASEEVEAARAAGQAADAGPAFLLRAGGGELSGPQCGGTLVVEVLTCTNLLAADRGSTCAALCTCRCHCSAVTEHAARTCCLVHAGPTRTCSCS
eukprot:COSAG06_NODE_3789_length_4901_cov_4.959600_1_plen_181_part_00